MKSLLKKLMALYKPYVAEYVKDQLVDLEVELATRWADGIPTNIKQITADVKAAVVYVLTHGSR